MNVWEGLDSQVQRIVQRIRPIGPAIGKAASEGDELAKRIVSNYSMLARRVDPMAAHITETALDEWDKRAGNR